MIELRMGHLPIGTGELVEHDLGEQELLVVLPADTPGVRAPGAPDRALPLAELPVTDLACAMMRRRPTAARRGRAGRGIRNHHRTGPSVADRPRLAARTRPDLPAPSCPVNTNRTPGTSQTPAETVSDPANGTAHQPPPYPLVLRRLDPLPLHGGELDAQRNGPGLDEVEPRRR